MTNEEKKLFNEICYVFLMGGNDWKDASHFSPDYISEKSEKRDNAPYFWRSLHPSLRGGVKKYCKLWHLPLAEWLDDLGLTEPTLEDEKTYLREEDYQNDK